MQGLRGHRRVGARIALVGDDLHAGRIGGFFERVVDEIAPGVVVADIADRLDAARGHPLHHRFHHHRRRLRNGNHPGAGIARHVSGRRQRDQRDFQFVRDRGDRERGRRGAGAHQHIDLVLLDQLAGVAGAGRRIGGIVELNRFDFDAVDLVLVDKARGETLRIRNADRGARAGHRSDQPDRNVSSGGREGHHRGDRSPRRRNAQNGARAPPKLAAKSQQPCTFAVVARM